MKEEWIDRICESIIQCNESPVYFIPHNLLKAARLRKISGIKPNFSVERLYFANLYLIKNTIIYDDIFATKSLYVNKYALEMIRSMTVTVKNLLLDEQYDRLCVVSALNDLDDTGVYSFVFSDDLDQYYGHIFTTNIDLFE